MPSVEALADKYADKAKFCSVNTGGNRRLAISQKVLGLPNVSFYKGGEKIAEVSGEVTVAAIEDELNKHINH